MSIPPDFDAFVERTRQAYDVPGAVVAIVRADDVEFLKGYGVRRIGGHDAVDAATRFQVASVSKFITATAVATLVDRDVVGWDTPVRSFSPQTVLAVPYASENATLRDYFAHRTGLPAYGGDLVHQLGYSTDELVRRARYLAFDHSFRERWAYSNYGIFLGQWAAAQAAGMSPPELITKAILAPLGMTRSGATVATLSQDANYASGHDIDGSAMPAENVDGFSGAGAVVSTGDDIARWMRMLLGRGVLDGKRVLSEAAVDAIFAASMVQGPGGPMQDPNDSSGLGCESYTFMGTRVIEKNGALNGVRTIVSLIPTRGLGIAIFANKQLTVFPEAVRAEFLDRVLGPSGRDLQAQIRAEQPAWHSLVALPKASPDATPISRALDDFAGDYDSPLYGTLTVRADVEGLSVAIGPARYHARLTHWSGDTFLLSFADPDVTPGLLRFGFGAAKNASAIDGGAIPGTHTVDYGHFERMADRKG